MAGIRPVPYYGTPSTPCTVHYISVFETLRENKSFVRPIRGFTGNVSERTCRMNRVVERRQKRFFFVLNKTRGE